MNATKIKKLSEQVCSLDAFHKRCLWSDAVLSISGFILDMATTALIKPEIHKVIDRRIEKLEAEIKKEATSG